MYNPESGSLSDFDVFSQKSVRLGFIRKVYSILSVQLIITFGFVLLFSHIQQAKEFAFSNKWIFFVSLIVIFVTLILMVCVKSLRRRAPHNFILLGIFTVAQGVLLSFSCVYIQVDIVRTAVLVTAFIVLGLTLFAFQTKWDFTILNGVMFALVLALMIFGIVLSFTPYNRVITIVYSSLGAFLFCVYIIIDTQSIIGGDHKYQISPEEYIFGALTLYMDIINLFTYILSILNEANK